MGDNRLIPQKVQPVLDELVRRTHLILANALVGVYGHGSLAMGCFAWSSSDIDILIVVKERIPTELKRDIGRLLLELSKDAPPKGLELSIVTLKSLRDFKYPTPFELHFSNSNKRDFETGQVNFENERTDPDLAAHIVVTKKRGICLYGEPIDAVFPDIPPQYYLRSITQDSEESYKNVMSGPDVGICKVPNYAVLNFCRVLAFVQDGAVRSKPEGGAWGLKNLPHEYASVIQAALLEYAKSDTSEAVDAVLLKAFAQYAWTSIQGMPSEALEAPG